MSAADRATLAAAITIALALLALLALHILEPELAITWAYAHLGRDRWRVALAGAGALALPAAGAACWSAAWGRRPPWRPSWRVATAAGVSLFAALLALGALAPAPALTLDSSYFKRAVAHPATPADRWLLAVESARPAARLLRAAGLDVEAAVIAINSLWSAVALLALAGAARLLARDRREQAWIALLAASAFGTLQVAIGYVDVYPIALAWTALFFWSALRALGGEASAGWAMAIAAVAPLFYLGSLLLWAPALVLLMAIARRDGLRAAARAAGAGALAAGVATLPLRGLPFDWLHFARRAAAGSAYQAGYLAESSLLPLWYAASAQHLREVASTIALVDPAGAALALAAGGALLCARGRSALDGPIALLASFVAGWLAYLLTMDAVFGAFADWDLFAAGAVGTSLLAGACYARWARALDRDAVAGAIAGLALAVSAAHLLARLHALPIEAARHVAESPLHVPAGALPARGAATD